MRRGRERGKKGKRKREREREILKRVKNGFGGKVWSSTWIFQRKPRARSINPTKLGIKGRMGERGCVPRVDTVDRSGRVISLESPGRGVEWRLGNDVKSNNDRVSRGDRFLTIRTYAGNRFPGSIPKGERAK